MGSSRGKLLQISNPNTDLFLGINEGNKTFRAEIEGPKKIGCDWNSNIFCNFCDLILWCWIFVHKFRLKTRPETRMQEKRE